MRLKTYLLLTVITGYLLTISIACEKSDSSRPGQTGQSGRTLDYTSRVFFLDSRSDTTATVDVAVADDNTSRSTGLMNVYDMPDNAGMLFIFEDEQPRSFWMSNTPLALDILFVNRDMEIVRIQRDAQPYSQEQILSEEPAMYVIETRSGFTIRHDITEGMRVDVEVPTGDDD